MKKLLTPILMACACLSPLFSQEKASPQKKEANQPTQAKEVTVVLSVKFQGIKGDIHLQLDSKRAPKTVENFLKYVDQGFYDGTVFHRVIRDFMIQGGGFGVDYRKKPTDPPIQNESKQTGSNSIGTIAMARTSDPNSATAQFFINVVNNPFLDFQEGPDREGYATFGKVTKGMEIIDRIRKIPTVYETCDAVGIALDDDMFVHSSTSRGVIVSSLSEAYYDARFLFARRLL